MVFSVCFFGFYTIAVGFQIKIPPETTSQQGQLASGVGKVTVGHANRLHYLARMVYSADIIKLVSQARKCQHNNSAQKKVLTANYPDQERAAPIYVDNVCLGRSLEQTE